MEDYEEWVVWKPKKYSFTTPAELTEIIEIHAKKVIKKPNAFIQDAIMFYAKHIDDSEKDSKRRDKLANPSIYKYDNSAIDERKARLQREREERTALNKIKYSVNTVTQIHVFDAARTLIDEWGNYEAFPQEVKDAVSQHGEMNFIFSLGQDESGKLKYFRSEAYRSRPAERPNQPPLPEGSRTIDNYYLDYMHGDYTKPQTGNANALPKKSKEPSFDDNDIEALLNKSLENIKRNMDAGK